MIMFKACSATVEVTGDKHMQFFRRI